MKKVVEKLLNDYPELRDNDNRLVCNVWFIQLEEMGINPGKCPGDILLKLITSNKLLNYKTVIKYRSELQRINPELRGKRSEKRHIKSRTIIHNYNIGDSSAK